MGKLRLIAQQPFVYCPHLAVLSPTAVCAGKDCYERFVTFRPCPEQSGCVRDQAKLKVKDGSVRKI